MSLPPLAPRTRLTTDPRLDLTLVSRESQRRPQSCPEPSRGHRNQDKDIRQLLIHKVRGDHGSALRQAFRASDAQGGGRVSREALYHILSNYLSPGISHHFFNDLLSLLGLSSVKTVTFDKFYSCLIGSSAQRPRSTYLPMRGDINGVVLQVLEKCRQLDHHEIGKLAPDQLRNVLQSFGVPITPMQLDEVCRLLGYREGGLVSYGQVLSHFTRRSKSGIIHSKLTDKNQRFHLPDPMRACASPGDGETRLIGLLNAQFLKILAAFKSHDRKGRGYVPKEVFLKVLSTYADGSPDVDSVAEGLCGENGWVPYPKFLALFEHAPPPDRPPTETTSCKEPGNLLRCIRELVSCRGGEVMEAFYSLDPNNTGRLTLATTLELLERFGIRCSRGELEGMWRGLLRNKDNTVQFQEFTRHFTEKLSSAEGHRHLTDDHHFMRSKTLHRDEDMTMEGVVTTLRHHRPTLLTLLTPHDPLNTGTVSTHIFLECVSSVCSDLSTEKQQLLQHRLGDTVEYRQLLTKPRPNPYRNSSNMSYVLAHKPRPSLTDTQPPSVLAARPPYGLSGVKGHLQKQLAKNWRLSRRLFRDLDRGRSGCVGVSELWGVMAQCEVELSSEDQFHILEMLDPQLQGTVNYNHLIRAVYEQ